MVVSSTTSTNSNIYFDNGTCKCPNASVGDTATISGTLYTVVDNSSIGGQIDNGNPNLCTSKVTNMANLFSGNRTTFNQNIDFWDTSNVTDMSGMFYFNNAFNQPIGNWDVSNVKITSRMFAERRSFNQPLGNWDVSNVVTMSHMFNTASSFNQDINSWDTSSA